MTDAQLNAVTGVMELVLTAVAVVVASMILREVARRRP